jgi:hypothetical protein
MLAGPGDPLGVDRVLVLEFRRSHCLRVIHGYMVIPTAVRLHG